MKTCELLALIFLLFGIAVFTLGSALYMYKLMARYSLDWEVQLAFSGFIIVLLALIVAKILSKVEFDG